MADMANWIWNVLTGGDDPSVYRYFPITCNAIAFGSWLLTLITGNMSQIDRLWPFLPTLYAWMYVYFSVGGFNVRVLIMALLITLWCVRLTYAAWRRGYYKANHEDHRWKYVLESFGWTNGGFQLQLFNFVFLSFFQNWLLFGITLPMWFVQTNKNVTAQSAINWLDWALVGAFLVFFAIEALADEQQWHFQTRKYAWLAEKRDQSLRAKSAYGDEEVDSFRRGFCCTGLFAYSRHPNYLGEITMWWIIYAFTLSSQLSAFTVNGFDLWTDLFNYSVIWPLALTLLFHGSTRLTEQISSGKYAQYADFQSNVGRIIPTSIFAYKPKASKAQ